MKIQTRNVLLVAVTLVMAYTLLFPSRLALEPAVSIDWAVPAAEVTTLPSLADNDKTVGLQEPQGVFFVEEGGQRGSWIAAPEAVSVANDRVARSQASPPSVEILSRYGQAIARIPGTGAPWFSGKDLALLGFGANVLDVFTQSGESRWRLETPDLISGYCACANGDSFVSFVGGELAWLDTQGAIRVTYRPGHGAVSAIYAMLWIESRQLLAVVVDLRPQTLVLLAPRHEKGGNFRFELVETVTLSRETRGQLQLHSLLDDTVLVIEQPEGLGVLLLDDSMRTVIPLTGRLVQVAGLTDARLLVCQVESPGGSQLLGLKPDGRLVFRQSVPSQWNDLVPDSRGRLVGDSAAGVQSLHFLAR